MQGAAHEVGAAPGPLRAQSSEMASAFAACQVPNRSVTVAGGGQSPFCSRAAASPPRRLAPARACETSHMRTAARRIAFSTCASLRAPDRTSTLARSRRDGRPCSIGRRRPCRCALGGGAAAAAYPLVAGFDRTRFPAVGVVEVALDGGGRATEARGDLRVGQPLGLPVVAGECDSPAALRGPLCECAHRPQTYRSCWTATEGNKKSPARASRPGRRAEGGRSERCGLGGLVAVFDAEVELI